MIKASTSSRDWIAEHIRTYLENGREAHFINLSEIGGKDQVRTLLLKTVGRKSGEVRFTPLLYGRTDGEYIVIASHGGRPAHPDWFLNLESMDEVQFKVADDCHRAAWRVAEGDERADAWARMLEIHALYDDYQARAGRRIPVVLLKPLERIDAL